MGLIDRLSKINSANKDPVLHVAASGKRNAYIESIRWKGQIYCQACKSPLKRVPVDGRWFEAPSYDPFTGEPLSWVQRYGAEGLMVCTDYEDRRSPFGGMSFQEIFAREERPHHGMYYTDQPPL